MKIKRIAINQIQRASYNPRIKLKKGTDRYERIKKSIDEFDLVQPLVWNEQTGNLVGGHQRLQVLEDSGIKDVSVVVVSLSLSREKSLNIALNNERIGGGWDYEKLGDLLGELQQLPDWDITLTGFDEKEVRNLLLEPAELELEEDDPSTNQVRVSLEVAKDDWQTLQLELDRLMQEIDSLHVHVDF